jgi:tetratricopeptide (TPR) repeat protein
VFGSHDLVHVDDKVLLHNLYGCDVQAVSRLLEGRDIELSESVETDEQKRFSGSDESFFQLLRYFECFMRGDVKGKLAMARQLKAARPWSPYIRMLVALAAHEQYIVSGKKDREARHLTDESFQETIRLLADGDSSYARTVFGCFLLYDGRSEDAVRQLREARQTAPRDTFIAISLLRALTGFKSEEALALGDSLCRTHPQRHACWFEYSAALREFGKFNDAVAAAENAIRTGGPNFYRGRLASVLTKAGRLDEAESVYEEMLEIQPREGAFWLWYARFLIEDRSQRQDQARHAVDQAEKLSTPRSVSRAELEQLRKLLDTK